MLIIINKNSKYKSRIYFEFIYIYVFYNELYSIVGDIRYFDHGPRRLNSIDQLYQDNFIILRGFSYPLDYRTFNKIMIL